MKDPCRNTELVSSFSFTGIIARIETLSNVLHLTIEQTVAGRLPTSYRLVIPRSVFDDEFPYSKGSTVMIQDAVVYERNSELRLRIADRSQISATTAAPGELNALAFSGEIIEVRKEQGYALVLFEQTVADRFPTRLEVMLPDTVELEHPPKVGDIGLVDHALLYEKDGLPRAKLTRPTYKVLYTPDYVLDLGTIDAKEAFI